VDLIAVLCGLSRSAGGVYYAGSSLCKALNSCGVDLTVYGKHDPYVEEDASAWSPIPVAAYQTFGPLGSSMQLRRLLRQGKPDLIHQHGLWMDDQWAALQWQKRNGKPVVISPHGMLDPWAIQNSAWKKKLVGKLFADESLKRATCIHALCQSEMESIRAYGLGNPVALIPNGVDMPAEDHGEHAKGDQRKRMLFLGRLHPKKGLSELLSGWACFRKQNPKACSEWQLVLAGWDDGGHLDGLIRQAEAMGLTFSVAKEPYAPQADLHFTGPQFGEDKNRLLRSVNAFILPSFSEGLPVSVLEAWSYGLPVVMTEFCNLPAGFSAGAALKVTPDEISISKGIETIILMSESELQDIGAKGRALVEQRFTWDKIAQDMKAVYEWCLGGSSPACVVE